MMSQALNTQSIMNEREAQAQQSPGGIAIALKKTAPQISVPSMNLEDIKRQRQSSFHGSPRSHRDLTKSSSTRCLCSPTTHVGSFRCRLHRAPGMPRGGSVGSNLSLLGASKTSLAHD
ncbi:uncharacterized protein LOC123208050 [Mangifera indica]|uniref:uncharacterized protein LOC123208050 n=1 Tax=Mangifera indica TaxID=29780 RepID=UPI001CFA0F1E|nr:uncharacterized protein LOC123208050 [Mangifera indica]